MKSWKFLSLMFLASMLIIFISTYWGGFNVNHMLFNVIIPFSAAWVSFWVSLGAVSLFRKWWPKKFDWVAVRVVAMIIVGGTFYSILMQAAYTLF